MAEKIVQLIDKDNNSLYPVAGSLKQGSVTTSTINDGAVTIDKIDSSSYNSNEFPVINTTTSNINVNSNRYYTQYTYTVPYAGTYFVTFSQRMVNGNNGRDFVLRIAHNDVEVSRLVTGGLTYVNYIAGTVIGIVRASVGDTIKCQSSGGGTNSYETSGGIVSIARIY